MADIAHTSDLEKNNLEVHVDLCALRYTQLDQRLSKVENKLDDISKEMKNSNSALIKVIISAAGSIVAALISAIVVLIMKF